MRKDKKMQYEQSDGQLAFLPINRTLNNLVVQSNALIKARQRLTLNEAKLIRIIIMQIVNSDMEFKRYSFTPGEFAELIGNKDSTNIYHQAEALCGSITRKPIEIKDESTGAWKKIPWVQICEWNPQVKRFEIKLNDELKPYLLNLVESGYYAQYQLESALAFSSVNALRIFELIHANIMKKVIPKEGMDIDISLDEIREACGLYEYDPKTGKIIKEKYQRISQIKERVIDAACKDIEESTLYRVSYSDIKKSRSIVGFRFHVQMAYHRNDFDLKKMKSAEKALEKVAKNRQKEAEAQDIIVNLGEKFKELN